VINIHGLEILTSTRWMSRLLAILLGIVIGANSDLFGQATQTTTASAVYHPGAPYVGKTVVLVATQADSTTQGAAQVKKLLYAKNYDITFTVVGVPTTAHYTWDIKGEKTAAATTRAYNGGANNGGTNNSLTVKFSSDPDGSGNIQLLEHSANRRATFKSLVTVEEEGKPSYNLTSIVRVTLSSYQGTSFPASYPATNGTTFPTTRGSLSWDEENAVTYYLMDTYGFSATRPTVNGHNAPWAAIPQDISITQSEQNRMTYLYPQRLADEDGKWRLQCTEVNRGRSAGETVLNYDNNSKLPHDHSNICLLLTVVHPHGLTDVEGLNSTIAHETTHITQHYSRLNDHNSLWWLLDDKFGIRDIDDFKCLYEAEAFLVNVTDTRVCWLFEDVAATREFADAYNESLKYFFKLVGLSRNAPEEYGGVRDLVKAQIQKQYKSATSAFPEIVFTDFEVHLNGSIPEE
jgi:hypothetical protein